MDNDKLIYPRAINPKMVGEYPALAGAGGGYVWHEVLEYRVWCCVFEGAEDLMDGDDYYYPFETYEEANQFSHKTKGAKVPVALILQKEYIDEPENGVYIHVKQERRTEWPVSFLNRPKCTPDTIPDFLSPNAPKNRLQILRGE